MQLAVWVGIQWCHQSQNVGDTKWRWNNTDTNEHVKTWCMLQIQEHIISNDKSFNQTMKWQLGVAWHAVSKQEGQSCLVGQQGCGVLWIAYWLVFGLQWEPCAQMLRCCTKCHVQLVKKAPVETDFVFWGLAVWRRLQMKSITCKVKNKVIPESTFMTVLKF